MQLYEDMMSENAKMKNELERLQRDLASARTRLNPPSASSGTGVSISSSGRAALSPARPPLPSYSSSGTGSGSGTMGGSSAVVHPHHLHHRELHPSTSSAGSHTATGSDSDVERHSLEHKIRQYEEELQVK